MAQPAFSSGDRWVALLRVVVAVLVTGVWVAAYGQAVIVPGTPTPPAELSGIMLAVVTWLFAGAARDVAGNRPPSERLRRRIGRWLLGEKESDTDDATR